MEICSFKRKNKSCCHFVLNISIQQALNPQSLRRIKRKNVGSSTEKCTGLLTAHGELSAAFFIIVLLTCWNSSLWEEKKKSPPDCCLNCTYLHTPTYSFVLCSNKSVGRNGKWSGIFGVRLCPFTRDHVLYFQIKTLYNFLAWFLLSLFPVRPPSNVGFPEKPPQCRRS